MTSRSGWWTALVSAVICGLPAAAQAGKTWYVNGLTGNDWLPATGTSIENTDGSANNQLRTLGHAFTLAHDGDTVLVDGPAQSPVVGSPGFDTKPNVFATISASNLTLQCRDPDFAIAGGIEVNGDNMVVFNCYFYGSGNNPAFYAGSSNGHYFENTTFVDSANSSGIGFEGSGNGYQFQHNRFISYTYAIQLDAPGTGTNITFNTFNGNSIGVYWSGGIGTIKYNLVQSGWGSISNSNYQPGPYDVDGNWYYSSSGSQPSGPDDYHSYNGAEWVGYYMLAPTSPAINSIYDPFTGVRITPGCCDVVTVQGNGGNSDFSNWQAWSGSAWTPITNTSYPVLESGAQLYLQDGANCAFVRGNPVQGLQGAKLKSLRADRGTYYTAQPGYRSDIDSDPSTPGREIEVRAVSCGSDQGITNGFSLTDTRPSTTLNCGGTPVQPPPGLFYKVINGATFASNQPNQPQPPAGFPPLTGTIGSADSGAPCWQAQLFLSRVLP